MRRLLVPLLVAFLAVPFAAEAQQAGKVYRVGLITYGVPLSEMAGPQPRQYGRTGLTYRTVSWVVPDKEQSHMRKEAGHGEGYYIRRAR
jgi:hypothetical protein